MSAPGDDRMSRLERRCRLLLRAYPATYRSARGEEIIGTLLEATPPGRAWPRSRDLRSLLAGSLRARAAQNRERTTAANLRVAALVGIAAYLALAASEDLRLSVRFQFAAARSSPYLAVGAVLALVTLALVWASGRRAVVLCGALPAAAALSYARPSFPIFGATAITYLACLATIVALASGRCRPGWRWLWPVGFFAAVPWLPAYVGVRPVFAVLLAITAVGIAWMAVDARPALAMAAFLLAYGLAVTISNVGISAAVLALLAIVTVIAAPATWLLHRQSARPRRLAR
jgi:hypothetical protein